ncbi:MAG: tetratricopeptide repeat protein [Helicobacteraceae bacterium]|jgi:TPR repeat protein|nr:tetratricopeptide repeat protein [Helicobacteraceae bacterium]
MKTLLLLLTALSLFGSDYALMKKSFDKGDINRAITIARTNAMNGNIPAMYDLGLLYYSKGSIREAKTWLERSVKNDGEGQLGVSLILFTQSSNRDGYKNVTESLINVPKGEIRDALMAVSKDLASNRDDASAENYLTLGELFSSDVIIRPDMRRALYLTNQAAKKGNPKALEMMGDAYWRSNLTQDSLIVAPQTGNALNVALEYYREASRLGNLDATVKMGRLFIIGPRNLRRTQEGVDLILKAANEGSALGAKTAAELYMSGQGVHANRQQALAWYQKATEICDVNNILANIYGQGEEAEKYAKAYESCVEKRSVVRRYHILFEPF